MIRAAVLVALALSLRNDDDPATILLRSVQKRLEAAREDEARRRLTAVGDSIRTEARTALFGEEEDPEKLTFRLFEARTLVLSAPHQGVRGFWDGPPALDGIEDPRGLADGEVIVDLIKERVGPGLWENDHTIDMTPGRQFLIHSVPKTHRKVARVLRQLETELNQEVRSTIAVYAVKDPFDPILAAGPDGTLADAAVERLVQKAAENGDVRRLAEMRLTGQADQQVAGFSGERRPLALDLTPEGRRIESVAEGVAVEARIVPAGPDLHLRARIGFKKILSVDEFPTPFGTLQLPRIAEIEIAENRRLPAGRWVLLSRAGPLPPETTLPPHVVVLVRASILP